MKEIWVYECDWHQDDDEYGYAMEYDYIVKFFSSEEKAKSFAEKFENQRHMKFMKVFSTIYQLTEMRIDEKAYFD